MHTEEALAASLALVERSPLALLGTNSTEGYPHIKALLNMEHTGLNTVWFSTNTSSRRVAQLRRDPRASVYFLDNQTWEGLLLVGNVEILQDAAARERLWRPGYEQYYPQGVTDPDYSVLRFTAQWGNYYHALANVTFTLPAD